MQKLGRFEVYGFWGVLKLAINIMRTRLFFSNARIIRFPIEIRGKKHIDFGLNLTTGVGCRIEAYPVMRYKKVIVFGKNVQLNDYVHITAMNMVYIGNNVLMASKIYISDCTHGSYKGNEDDSLPISIPIEREYSISQVIIEDNVWIGEGVSILPGVTIGKGSIIGANSLINRSIPDGCMVVGNPGRIVKKFNETTKRWERYEH